MKTQVCWAVRYIGLARVPCFQSQLETVTKRVHSRQLCTGEATLHIWTHTAVLLGAVQDHSFGNQTFLLHFILINIAENSTGIKPWGSGWCFLVGSKLMNTITFIYRQHPSQSSENIICCKTWSLQNLKKARVGETLRSGPVLPTASTRAYPILQKLFLKQVTIFRKTKVTH